MQYTCKFLFDIVNLEIIEKRILNKLPGSAASSSLYPFSISENFVFESNRDSMSTSDLINEIISRYTSVDTK